MQGALQYILQELPPELSRTLRLDEITNVANTIIIDAAAPECASLAERFDLPCVRNLSAEITYRRTRSGQMVRIDGRITANYSQLCSATLAPMPMIMEETFQTEYTLVPWEKFSEFDLDQPEVLSDDFIDVGEITAQYFGLSLDPYARRANQETLAELTETISETIAELVNAEAEQMPEHAEIKLEVLTADNENSVMAPPLSEEPYTGEEAPMGESVVFLRVEIDPNEAEEDLVTQPEEAPAGGAEANESLFFRYLRQMREN